MYIVKLFDYVLPVTVLVSIFLLIMLVLSDLKIILANATM